MPARLNALPAARCTTHGRPSPTLPTRVSSHARLAARFVFLPFLAVHPFLLLSTRLLMRPPFLVCFVTGDGGRGGAAGARGEATGGRGAGVWRDARAGGRPDPSRATSRPRARDRARRGGRARGASTPSCHRRRGHPSAAPLPPPPLVAVHRVASAPAPAPAGGVSLRGVGCLCGGVGCGRGVIEGW